MSSDDTEHTTKGAPGSSGAVNMAFAVFAAFMGAAAAGAAAYYLPGMIGVAGATGFSLGGALSAIWFARGANASADERAHLVLDLAARGDDPSVLSAPPASFRGVWKDLYKRVAELAVQARASGSALLEMERLHGQIETAAIHFRDGRDPLLEEAELRVGPLREFLEAARESSSYVEPFSASPPVTAQAAAAPVDGILDEIIEGLERLERDLASGADPVGEGNGAPLRTPAQLVDAVVNTAANGIEDLAGGLMRANELASVAERVTNRATLLALNAALEATRSGSEAFGAIAEETRRLAEFAREATDTIARLAEEIEVKVGETITAIHMTSEDAKMAVASLGGASSHGADFGGIRIELNRLITRARSLRGAAPSTLSAGSGLQG